LGQTHGNQLTGNFQEHIQQNTLNECCIPTAKTTLVNSWHSLNSSQMLSTHDRLSWQIWQP